MRSSDMALTHTHSAAAAESRNKSHAQSPGIGEGGWLAMDKAKQVAPTLHSTSHSQDTLQLTCDCRSGNSKQLMHCSSHSM